MKLITSVLTIVLCVVCVGCTEDNTSALVGIGDKLSDLDSRISCLIVYGAAAAIGVGLIGLIVGILAGIRSGGRGGDGKVTEPNNKGKGSA